MTGFVREIDDFVYTTWDNGQTNGLVDGGAVYQLWPSDDGEDWEWVLERYLSPAELLELEVFLYNENRQRRNL